MKKLACCCSAGLLALGGASAWAQSSPSGGRPIFGVSVGAQQRVLVERAEDGRQLVEESGPMVRLGFDIGWTLARGGAMQATLGVAGGTLDYDGQTQGGTPLQSKTDHGDLDLAFAWRPVRPAAWGQGWLLIRLEEQYRHINSTSTARGLEETSVLLLPGMRWTHEFQAASVRWQPSLELRASVYHYLNVDSGGVFDDADLDGGHRRELVLGLDVGPLRSPWSFGIGWTHTRQSVSPTQTLTRNGVPYGTVHQPRIEIDDVLLRVRRVF